MYDTCREDKLPHPGRTSGTQGETDEAKEEKQRNPLITDTNQAVKEIGQVAFMLLNFTSLSLFSNNSCSRSSLHYIFVKHPARQGGLGPVHKF